MNKQEWRETYLNPITNHDGSMLETEAETLVLIGLTMLAWVDDIGTNYDRLRLSLRLLEAWEQHGCAYQFNVR